jgi:hypothetical protein
MSETNNTQEGLSALMDKVRLMIWLKKWEIAGQNFYIVGDQAGGMTHEQIEALETLGSSIKDPLDEDFEPEDISQHFGKIEEIIREFIKDGFNAFPKFEEVYMPVNYKRYPDGGTGRWGIPEFIREAVQNAKDASGHDILGIFGEGSLVSTIRSCANTHPIMTFTRNTLITARPIENDSQNRVNLIKVPLDFTVKGTVVVIPLEDFEVKDATKLVVDIKNLGQRLTSKKDQWTIYESKGEASVSVGGLVIEPFDSELHLDFHPDLVDLNRDRTNTEKLNEQLVKVIRGIDNSGVAKTILEEVREGKDWATAKVRSTIWGYTWRYAFKQLFPDPKQGISCLATSQKVSKQAIHSGHDVIDFPKNWTEFLKSCDVPTDKDALHLDEPIITRKISWLKSKGKEDFPDASTHLASALKLLGFSQSIMTHYFPEGDIDNLEHRKILRKIVETKILVLVTELNENGTEKHPSEYRSFYRDGLVYLKPESLDQDEFNALRVLVHEISHDVTQMLDDSDFQFHVEKHMAEIGINAYRSRLPRRKRT